MFCTHCRLAFSFIVVIVLTCIHLPAKGYGAFNTLSPGYGEDAGKWVDSVFNTLTPARRIGQLFVVEAGIDTDVEEIAGLVKNFNIGGIAFTGGGPLRQAKMTNRFQELSSVPLMIAMKAEGGLGATLDSMIKFPQHLALAAVNDNRLVYDLASDLARQMRRLGVHMNLSPLPVQHESQRIPANRNRSSAHNGSLNAGTSGYYLRGMLDNGVLVAGRHTMEFYYSHTITGESMPGTAELPGIMENRTDYSAGEPVPALVFSEDMRTGPGPRRSAGNLRTAEYPEVRALLSGKEVLLFPDDAGRAVEIIEKAINEGILTRGMIDEKCRRVLFAKYQMGLSAPAAVATQNLYRDLNGTGSELLRRKVTSASLTLLENRNGLVPFKRLDTLRIATVSVGDGKKSPFQEAMSLYAPMSHYTVSKYATLETLTSVINDLDGFNLVIIGIDDADYRRSRQYGISPQTSWFVRRLSARNNVVLALFASPNGLAFFDDLSNLQGLLVAYEDNPLTQEYTAQLVFGGLPAVGRLPVSPIVRFPSGLGYETASLGRLRYCIPEEAGMDSRKLSGIEDIVKNAIEQKAAPGVQVLVARKGIVVYHKAFGHHTYTGENPVILTDLYDLASITKIAASVPAIMKLQEERSIDIYQTLGHYIPRLRETNKNNLVIKDVLTHQARLQSWIPFIWDTFESLIPGEELFSKRVSARYPYMLGDFMYMNRHYRLSANQFSDRPSDVFTIRVGERMFMNRSYVDSMYMRIDESPLRSSNSYFYSDLGYYYLKEILEQASGERLDHFLDKNLYRPLGASRLTYLPLEKYGSFEIVPTENDVIFRRQLVHGHVHDAGTAMIGGVGGHAGLFSNANDLAKLMQLFLQNGEYGGTRFFSGETVRGFTSAPNSHNGNRRGIGFDKPEMRSSRSPAARSASSESYGHSGFTGTMAWADPAEDIIYIFLSNRVHPDQFNNKLTELNVRTRIQQLIYDSIIQ
jgi:beta-N-acetylhexosaminidase